jgi:hypothetical protein
LTDLLPPSSLPKDFRNLQAKTDAIVSGYFAIDFFDRRNPVRDEAILQIQVGKASVNMTLAYLEEDGWEIIHDTCPEDDVYVDGFYRVSYLCLCIVITPTYKGIVDPFLQSQPRKHSKGKGRPGLPHLRNARPRNGTVPSLYIAQKLRYY